IAHKPFAADQPCRNTRFYDMLEDTAENVTVTEPLIAGANCVTTRCSKLGPVHRQVVRRCRPHVPLIAMIFQASEKFLELRVAGAFRIWRPAKVQGARSVRRR